MPRPVRLETFVQASVRSEAGGTLVMPAEALEETKLAAFENGYRAGWDDAVAAQEDEAQRLGADVARNLQGLSFTYHEARGHLLRGLAPLMDEICARILPTVAREGLAGLLRETLEPLAAAALDRPVVVVANPAARPAVEAALAAGSAPPVEIVEEPSLGPGQLHLRWPGEERRIDLDAAVAEIAAAVKAFFAEAEAAAAPPGANPPPAAAATPKPQPALQTDAPTQEMRRHG